VTVLSVGTTLRLVSTGSVGSITFVRCARPWLATYSEEDTHRDYSEKYSKGSGRQRKAKFEQSLKGFSLHM